MSLDEATVTRVLVENHRTFLAFLTKRTGDPQVAEDLLQDALARGITRAGTVRDETTIVAWFYQSLRNALTDHYRRQDARRRAHDRFEDEAETAFDPELQEVVCACVLSLAETLKPEYAEAIRAIDLGGAPVKDFAAANGLTATNAGVRVFRAREALRKQVVASCGTCASHGCRSCSCGGPKRGPGAGSAHVH